MPNPIESIALSVAHNPGLYALIIGSGLSRSANIPTGWEITIDLLKKLAVLNGDKHIPNDEDFIINEYKAKYLKEPIYSDLVELIGGKTPHERQKLLAGYIEPSEAERADGFKIPTKAHHSIAQLVKDGYIKIIVTTNFDRLMENALKDVGIEAVIIATPDNIKGMLPLQHEQVIILKLHGDYKDSRIKNTEVELASYDKNISRLLSRILDEYGLIIAGWSGEYDYSLRKCIAAAPNRRFSNYWLYINEPCEAIQQLIKDRAGNLIYIEDANIFFPRLEEIISYIKNYKLKDPLSLKIVISTTKQYITNDNFRIKLHDFIYDLSKRATAQLSDMHSTPNFFMVPNEINEENMLKKLSTYDSIIEYLSTALSICCYWGNESQQKLVVNTVKSMSVITENLYNGYTTWLDIAYYPLLIIAYTCSVSAILCGNYKLFKMIMFEIMITKRENSEKVDYLGIEIQKKTSINGCCSSPNKLLGEVVSDRATEIIYNKIKSIVMPLILIDERSFKMTYHRFEMIYVLEIYRLEKNKKLLIPASFVRDRMIQNSISEEVARFGAELPFFKADFFEGKPDVFKEVMESFFNDLRQFFPGLTF